jgi:hypothetical protein
MTAKLAPGAYSIEATAVAGGVSRIAIAVFHLDSGAKPVTKPASKK